MISVETSGTVKEYLTCLKIDCFKYLKKYFSWLKKESVDIQLVWLGNERSFN